MLYIPSPAHIKHLYNFARPLLRLKQRTSEFLIVNKVADDSTGFGPEYFVTPEGWTSSLQVPAEKYEQIQIGDVIKATWSPLSREILWFSVLGSVDAEYEIVNLAPDYHAIDTQVQLKLSKIFTLTLTPLTLVFFWIYFDGKQGIDIEMPLLFLFLLGVAAYRWYSLHQQKTPPK